MNKDFNNFLNALMEAAPEVVEAKMTDSIKAYIEALNEEKVKPIMTERGAEILKFLQEHSETEAWKSKDIAEQMGLNSRSVSGGIRKLVTDGFVDKVGSEPCIYIITEKGKNFIFD